MKFRQDALGLLLRDLYFGAAAGLNPATDLEPVIPVALPEAVKLLEYLPRISGKQTLTGRHCVPPVGSTRLVAAHRQRHYPILK